MASGSTAELTLKDALGVILRARILIMVCILLGTLLGYYFQAKKPIVYTSSATIRNGSANTYGYLYPVISNQEAQVIFQNPAALLEESGNKASAFDRVASASISFQKIDDSYYFVLTVSSTRKNEAKELCRELAEAYIREGNARQNVLLKPMRDRVVAIPGELERLNEELRLVEERIDTLRARGKAGDLAELTSLEMRYGNLLGRKTQLEKDLIDLQLKLESCKEFAIVSQPSPEKTTRVSPTLIAAAGALAGFMLGTYIAFLSHYLKS